MYARAFAPTALLTAFVTLGACSSDTTLGLGAAGGTGGDALSNARVRIANATATSFDVASHGVVFAGNAAIGFGLSSNCTPTNAATPDLSVRVAGTLTPVPGLATAYQSGVDFTVIAYPNAVGTTQFATVADLFTPLAGQSALRVFNAAATGTSYDVYVTDPGESLTAAAPTFNNVVGGTFTTFANVIAGTQKQMRITNAGFKTLLLDIGSTALIAGQDVTLVIAPPAAGSSTVRSFFVTACKVVA